MDLTFSALIGPSANSYAKGGQDTKTTNNGYYSITPECITWVYYYLWKSLRIQ